MNYLFLDLETAPTDKALEELVTKFKEHEPQQPEEIKLQWAEKIKELSLSALTARIVCMGYAANNQPAAVVQGDEAEILNKFWEMAPTVSIFVGHNAMDFDLKFICQRSIINRIKPSRDISFVRFRQQPIYDTMQEWNKWGFQGKASLDALCKALEIPTPKTDEVNGSKVFELYQAGRIDDICQYCKKDVEAVREVFKRMSFL